MLKIEELGYADVPMSLLLLADPSERKLRDYLPNTSCFVRRQEGEVIAVAAIKNCGADTYELMNLAVSPTHQQTGIGTALLREVIDVYRQRGAVSLIVGTGSFGYPLKFYQKLGFRVVSVERDFYLQHYDEPIFESGILLRDMIRLAFDYRGNKTIEG